MTKRLSAMRYTVKPFSFIDSNDLPAVVTQAVAESDVLYEPTDNVASIWGKCKVRKAAVICSRASIRSRPAAGVFSNRAANSICSGAQHGFQRLKYFGAHRSLRRPLTKARYFFSQVTLLAFPYSASTPTSCRTPKHSDILPRTASSTNRKYAIPDYFAEEKLAVQGRLSGRIAGGMQKGMKAHLDGVSHGCYTV